ALTTLEHTHHRRRTARTERFPDDLRVTAEAGLPRIVRQHEDALRVGPVIRRTKQPTQRGTCTQRGEPLLGHDAHIETFRLLAYAQVDLRALPDRRGREHPARLPV